MERELITLTIICIAVIASAGVGLSIFAISKAYSVEAKQEELKDALNDLERQVFVGQEKYAFLHSEVRKVTSVLDQLIVDFTLYKEKVVELQYLISYLIGKFLDGRKVLKATEKAWKKKEMNSEFFEYLNFTLPCQENCPIDLGRFHSCQMKEERDQILMDFTVPVVNSNLTKVHADAFDLMLKKGNLTCVLKYTGPTVATVSVEEDCVYKTHMDTGREKLAFALTQKCSNSSLFPNDEKSFRVDSCKTSQPGDEKDFIQIKISDNLYHIYCPKSNYMIGKRVIACPNKVFQLPLSLSFTLNGIEYKGSMLKIVYRERTDPFLSEHINYHLNPRLNWNNLTSQFDSDLKLHEQHVKEEMKGWVGFQFYDDNQWIMSEVLAVLFGGLLLLFVGLYIIKRWVKKKCTKRVKGSKEEIALVQAPVPHHLIIQA